MHIWLPLLTRFSFQYDPAQGPAILEEMVYGLNEWLRNETDKNSFLSVTSVIIRSQFLLPAHCRGGWYESPLESYQPLCRLLMEKR